MERITSNKNPLLQHIRKLQSSRSYREECGEFVADGFKLLDEALKWYPRLKTVVLSEGCDCPSLPAGVRLVQVPQGTMENLSTMKTPQGVVFTGEIPQQKQVSIKRGAVLLDRIQDPGNLGTILRTADAFDIPVILTNGCADPYSEKTIRASMGAVFRRPIFSADMEQILRLCRAEDIPLAATALTETAVDLRSIDISKHLVIIGSEGQGICSRLLEASDRQIIIPMHPHCESLNAAVAAAVVMWEMKH